jgi:hypothetical protein
MLSARHRWLFLDGPPDVKWDAPASGVLWVCSPHMSLASGDRASGVLQQATATRILRARHSGRRRQPRYTRASLAAAEEPSERVRRRLEEFVRIDRIDIRNVMGFTQFKTGFAPGFNVIIGEGLRLQRHHHHARLDDERR